MTRYYNLFAALSCAMLLSLSCTEDTGTLGVMDSADEVCASTASFLCYTSSIALDSMRSVSDKCYLGQITDPETGTTLKADFVAQFSVLESALLPSSSRMVCDADGNYECDSVGVRLFFQKYYGDGTAPFKLSVHELSIEDGRMLREDSAYYTNVDFSRFIASRDELSNRKGLPSGVTWPITKVFTPKDYTERDSALNSSTHYNNINVSLPASYGKRILNLYRTNPEYFASSYHFIRNVCPGFYFNITDGNGAMMYVDVSSLDVYFRYHNTDTTTVQGVCRFSATGEVIQATRFECSANDQLVTDESCTYIKSPAGIGTVVRLPVDKIFEGHENDSIALASISFMRYNSEMSGGAATLTPCSQLLMVERSEMNKFFGKDYVLNPRAFAVTSLSESYNIYTFNNIGRLVSYLHEKKRTRAKALGLTESEYASAHPEWNEVVLMPVTVVTSGNQIVSVAGDMSIASTRLVGGKDSPITIQVVYSRYSKSYR